MNKVKLEEITPTKKPQKRFIVFGHDDHYPAGGFGDEIHSTDTLHDATEFLKNLESPNDTHDIYDRKTGQLWSVEVEKIFDDS